MHLLATTLSVFVLSFSLWLVMEQAYNCPPNTSKKLNYFFAGLIGVMNVTAFIWLALEIKP